MEKAIQRKTLKRLKQLQENVTCNAMTINQEIQRIRIYFLAECIFSKVTQEVEKSEYTNDHRNQKDCQRSTFKKVDGFILELYLIGKEQYFLG